jgi:regulator of sirC expression with transglutaminase-like and TPR domain
MTREQIELEISSKMPLDEFLKIQERLAFLRKEEDLKLKALAELQQIYVAAASDQEREMVKQAVGQIREISKKTREEIRAFNTMIHQHMTLEEAKELYEKYLKAL